LQRARGVFDEPLVRKMSSSMPDGALVDFLEKVVAFIVDQDEGREVVHRDFPNGFHS
jgi:hypothetical protein